MSLNHSHSSFLLNPKDALERLKAGNARFLAGDTHTPSLEGHLLDAQSKGQQPYVTILGCSDSRVPPELIFDAWLGELFVIRVAGNVIGPTILGTLQYATRHLHTPLFVVMGHEGCGAVDAAISYKFEGQKQAEKIETLLETILPSLDGINPSMNKKALLASAVEANVRHTVKTLSETPEGISQIAQGAMLIGAVYDIHTGKVRFLE